MAREDARHRKVISANTAPDGSWCIVFLIVLSLKNFAFRFRYFSNESSQDRIVMLGFKRSIIPFSL